MTILLGRDDLNQKSRDVPLSELELKHISERCCASAVLKRADRAIFIDEDGVSAKLLKDRKGDGTRIFRTGADELRYWNRHDDFLDLDDPDIRTLLNRLKGYVRLFPKALSFALIEEIG